MKLSQKKIDDYNIELTVTEDAAAFSKEITRTIKQLGERVRIPGFRKGKVPTKLLEQHLGKETIIDEASNALIQRDFTDAFQTLDLILTPTTPNAAFKLGEMTADPLTMYLQDICTVPVNIAGLPGISIPCGVTNDGLPLAFQLIGKALDEATILRAAFTYESNGL